MSDRPASSRLSTSISAPASHSCRCVALAVALATACSKAPEAGRTPARAGDGRDAEIVPVSAAQVRDVVAAARGDVVLLNVWATWCNPCRQEFPHLVRLQRELAGQGFSLVLVSADFDRQLPKVGEFLAGHGWTSAPTERSARTPSSSTESTRAGPALPATFLYDRGGTLRDFWEGQLSYEEFLERVRPWLDAKTS
jgi:thiol-disulfide isomerase/thioredoxin